MLGVQGLPATHLVFNACASWLGTLGLHAGGSACLPGHGHAQPGEPEILNSFQEPLYFLKKVCCLRLAGKTFRVQYIGRLAGDAGLANRAAPLACQVTGMGSQAGPTFQATARSLHGFLNNTKMLL